MDAQITEQFWPSALDAHRLDDEVFADAYARVEDLRRAQLKAAIAGLYALYAGRVPAGRLTAEDHGPAGTTLSRLVPKAWTLICLDAAFSSPARLLAACLPALCARVQNLAVVRLDADAPWPPALVLALELAGVENVFDCPLTEFPGICADLASRPGSGLFCDLGGTPAFREAEALAEVYRLRSKGRIGVWEEGGAVCDRDALAFAQPDGDIVLPAGKARGEAAFEAFLGQGHDALWVPDRLARRALAAAPLVLGPGREVFWAFADLFPERFCDAGLAWLNDSTLLEHPERT